MIETETRRIDVGDADIHVEVTGEGPDLLLVAGLGGRGAFWTKQVQDFATRFRVITHDHRGCGNSSPGKAIWGAEQMAEDLVALMDAMDLRKAHLVGHSTGGAIGQHIALRWPERIDRLVLSCSWAGPDAYFEQLFRMRREILINCGPLAYYTSGTYLAHPGAYLQAQMKDARAFMEARMAAWPGLEVELSRLAAVAAHDLRTHVHRIGHRTLCIGAADDQLTPAGFTRELAALIPDAILHLLPYGGHFCPMTQTQDYNARVLQFLESGT